jgi:hypothetical protein
MTLTRKPRIHRLLWIAVLGGLVALGCKELESILLSHFPSAGATVRVAVVVVFALALVQVSIRPFFAEIGKPLR